MFIVFLGLKALPASSRPTPRIIMGRKTGQRRQLLQHGGLATDFVTGGREAAPRDEASANEALPQTVERVVS